jgi:hypothetical protein
MTFSTINSTNRIQAYNFSLGIVLTGKPYVGSYVPLKVGVDLRMINAWVNA